MTTATSPNNKAGNWKDWCIQVFERVAESSGTCACMPLPFDGRTMGGVETAEHNTTTTTATAATMETVDEEDEVIRIDDLYLHKTVVEGSAVSKLPTTTTTTMAAVEDRRSSTTSTATPFPLLPRVSRQTSSSSSTANARFLDYESRSSFDSLARSTDTGGAANNNNFPPLQRELPSFGTHKSHNTRETDHSNGMSSYSQTYTPALSSYLYRHKSTNTNANTNTTSNSGGGGGRFGMAEKQQTCTNTTMTPATTNRTTSMTSLLSWQSVGGTTAPTSNTHAKQQTLLLGNDANFAVVQHCE